jgi:hypothetical protein
MSHGVVFTFLATTTMTNLGKVSRDRGSSRSRPGRYSESMGYFGSDARAPEDWLAFLMFLKFIRSLLRIP